MRSLMLVWNGYRFFYFLFLLCYGDFSFDIFSGEISLYFLLYFQAVSRVYLSIYYSHLLFCLFWGWIVGTFLAGRVVFSFCVRLRYVECRAGTIYLSVGLEWVAGLYGFFFSWALLRWVRYD